MGFANCFEMSFAFQMTGQMIMRFKISVASQTRAVLSPFRDGFCGHLTVCGRRMFSRCCMKYNSSYKNGSFSLGFWFFLRWQNTRSDSALVWFFLIFFDTAPRYLQRRFPGDAIPLHALLRFLARKYVYFKNRCHCHTSNFTGNIFVPLWMLEKSSGRRFGLTRILP
jgi:hypothetical protein